MNLNASNILLCLQYGIGDLIMEPPLIDRLRMVLPRAKLTGLGADPAIKVLDDDGRLDAVTSIQQWGIQHLGNDSGLMHLAAAVGTPVVILFGPTVPELYLPQWVRSRAVVSGTPCVHRPRRVFGRPRCILAETCLTGTPCVQTIDPDRVCAVGGEEYRG